MFIDDLDSSSAHAPGQGQGQGPSAGSSGGGGGGRRIKVVWSDSLALVHKFATFQTTKPLAQFQDALKAYVRRCYALDAEIRIDEVLPTTVRCAVLCCAVL